MTKTSPNNSTFARQAWLRALSKTASITRDPAVTLPVLVDSWAQRWGDAPALIAREETLSYRELASRVSRYARVGLACGIAPGDSAALLMGNCAEYIAIWLGLTRIGASVALVNRHLTGAGLAHSIAIVSPKVVFVDAEHADIYLEAMENAAVRPVTFTTGAEQSGIVSLHALAVGDRERLNVDGVPLPTLDMTALRIYTSGTTGLPKAANVSHYRLMQWSHWFAGLLDTGPADRVYNCLPLYHSVGGVVATFSTLVGGGAVVIRPRFSASEFWSDVRAERCTLFQYIGELCRYLVSAPPAPDAGNHGLRIAFGNGLRGDVWNEFQQRFAIPHILEYYASTEGNFSLYNCEGEPGAIGRIPAFLSQQLAVTLVRVDAERGEPLRNADGLCQGCEVDEAGEALGRIAHQPGSRVGAFEGYTDGEASTRKVLRDVLTKGDSWYRTGDLMRRDARGFYYFVDRLGDTFRWKGENVSTTEVEAACASATGVLEAVAYGVAVPGSDGRAGMAALRVDSTFDINTLRPHLITRLPAYARPVFIRLLNQPVDTTGTFKPRKRVLIDAGFEPVARANATGTNHLEALAVSAPSDPDAEDRADIVYVDDPQRATYVLADRQLLEEIRAGRHRF